MSNTLKFIGDELIVTSQSGICHLESITGFTDTLLGTSATRTVDRYVRFSREGIVYSDWLTLVTGTLTSQTFDPEDVVFIETKYIRTGSDSSGVIAFVDLQYQITTATVTAESPSNMLLKAFPNGCCDLVVYKWVRSVTHQLYLPGLVPTYIERSDTFLKIWRALCCVPSLIVNYGRLLQQTTTKEEWGRSLLFNYDVLVFDQGQGVAQRPQFTNIVRSRGTSRAFTGELSWLLRDDNKFFSVLDLDEYRSGLTINNFHSWDVFFDADEQTLAPSQCYVFGDPIVIDPRRTYLVSFEVWQNQFEPAISVDIDALDSDEEDVLLLVDSLGDQLWGFGDEIWGDGDSEGFGDPNNSGNTVMSDQLLSQINRWYPVQFNLIGTCDEQQYESTLALGFGVNLHLVPNVHSIALQICNTGAATTLKIRNIRIELARPQAGSWINSLAQIHTADSATRNYLAYDHHLPYNTQLITHASCQ